MAHVLIRAASALVPRANFQGVDTIIDGQTEAHPTDCLGIVAILALMGRLACQVFIGTSDPISAIADYDMILVWKITFPGSRQPTR